jgi:REP element-mobilizing transposase RayT
MVLNKLGIKVYECWNNIKSHFPNIEMDEYFRPLLKTNLSNVIKGFKIGVTKWCKENNYQKFKWQRSFYERIIRNEKELFKIRKYIQQNPIKWDIEKGINNLDI